MCFIFMRTQVMAAAGEGAACFQGFNNALLNLHDRHIVFCMLHHRLITVHEGALLILNQLACTILRHGATVANAS